MRRLDVASIDLNLLVVLEALLVERHVTRAAERIHSSQPAVSRALARLRDMFDDPLLVRVGQQMQLTDKARSLLSPLQEVIGGVQRLVEPETFEPHRARGVIRLAAPDIIVYMLVPLLLARLAKEAPELDVEIVQWSTDWLGQLTSGEADLTIGQTVGVERGIYSCPLVRNDWVTVLRRGHPALREKWSLATFAKYKHLLIGFTSKGGGHVDTAMARLGRKRRVGLRMPYVLLSPLVAAETDLVLTTARWLAIKLSGQGLILKQPPRELGLVPVDLPLVWHERVHRDPRQRWLRSLLVELATTAGMTAR